MAGGHLLSFGVLAAELSESEANRRVLLTAGALALLGVVVLAGTVWWWRSTRPEHPALGPLEVMGERRWTRAGAEDRQRMLDESRPAPAADAESPQRSAPAGAADKRDGAADEAPVAAPAAATVTELPPVDLAALVASASASSSSASSRAGDPDDLSAFDEFLGLAPQSSRAQE